MTLPRFADHSFDELTARLAEWGEPPYRARQLFQWAYVRGAETYAAMSDVPRGLRQRLQQEWALVTCAIRTRRTGEDETTKYLIGLADGQAVEAVYMPARARRTLCVSTQVGCKFTCAFCASGKAGFVRPLATGEIVEQVLIANRHQRARVDHLVVMGMGEPLDNYDAMLKALRILNHPAGLRIGARRMTISTVGLVPRILQLAKEEMQFELSISLHGADDATRGRIMPVNRRYPVGELLEAARAYTAQTKRIITFEYILIRGVNDRPAAARELARRLSPFPCRVNLIPLNPIADYEGERPERGDVLAFAKVLKAARVNATVRWSRGGDIDAACGQLRLRLQKVPGTS